MKNRHCLLAGIIVWMLCLGLQAAELEQAEKDGSYKGPLASSKYGYSRTVTTDTQQDTKNNNLTLDFNSQLTVRAKDSVNGAVGGNLNLTGAEIGSDSVAPTDVALKDPPLKDSAANKAAMPTDSNKPVFKPPVKLADGRVGYLLSPINPVRGEDIGSRPAPESTSVPTTLRPLLPKPGPSGKDLAWHQSAPTTPRPLLPKPGPSGKDLAWHKSVLIAMGQTVAEHSNVATPPPAPTTPRVKPSMEKLLQKLVDMGGPAIHEAGGLAGIAKKEGVGLRTLNIMINERGQLTFLGKQRMAGGAKNPVTAEFLQTLVAKGQYGIEMAGGLAKIGFEAGVNIATLREMINYKGELKEVGQRKLVEYKKNLNMAKLLHQLILEGEAGIRSRGSLDDIAKAEGGDSNTLKKLIKPDGTLYAQGQEKVDALLKDDKVALKGGSTELKRAATPVESADLVAAKVARLEGEQDQAQTSSGMMSKPEPKTLLPKPAAPLSEPGPSGTDLRWPPSLPTVLALASMRQSMPAKATLEPVNRSAMGELLVRLVEMGETGIKAGGGLEEIGQAVGVDMIRLNRFINDKGQLKPVGQRTVVEYENNVAMAKVLRRLALEGRAGILSRGGLDKIAQAEGVHAGSLKTLIHVDGTLKPKGKEKVDTLLKDDKVVMREGERDEPPASPKIKSEAELDDEVRWMTHRVDDNLPILQDPKDIKRSLMSALERPVEENKVTSWAGLNNVFQNMSPKEVINAKNRINEEARSWLRDEGQHASRFAALIEVAIPIDDQGDRGRAGPSSSLPH